MNSGKSRKPEDGTAGENILTKSSDIENPTSAAHTQAAAISNLNGEMIAVLATDGFDQSEFLESKRALEQEGAVIKVVSPKSGHITGSNADQPGEQLEVEVDIKKADVADYHGLILPGGRLNADELKKDRNALDFVRAFYASGKPIAVVSDANRIMAEIDSDLDESGPVNHRLITGEESKDSPDISKALIEELIHQRKSRINIAAVDV